MLEPVLLLLILVATIGVSHLVGAFVYAVLTLPSAIPYFGKIYAFAINGPLKLTLVLKLIAWSISSSGILAGLWVHSMLWGPPNQLIEYWIILAVAVLTFFRLSHDILLFKPQTDYSSSVNLAANFLGDNGLVNESRSSLARSHFVNMYLPPFFHSLLCIGVTFYTLGPLGLVELIGPDCLNE